VAETAAADRRADKYQIGTDQTGKNIASSRTSPPPTALAPTERWTAPAAAVTAALASATGGSPGKTLAVELPQWFPFNR
jgi:hypothetical protein